MTSGTRKPPPISTNSPRDTATPRPRASAASSEQHRRGTVVDDERGFGTARSGQQRSGVVAARPPLAAAEVELEVRVVAPIA